VTGRVPVVLVAYGTRPEAIKLAPLIEELRRVGAVRVVVAVTGQHREMLAQVHEIFGITADHDLDILRPGQTLADVTQRSLTGITDVLAAVSPEALVVQGDTTSCFAASLAGFYAKTPVVHLEAGLRTTQRYSPFPEEINRRLTTQLTTLHLAPTAQSRANLVAENVDPADIAVTGNTVIDALLGAVDRAPGFADPRLRAAAAGPYVVVTTHRRESWGEAMGQTMAAVRRLAQQEPGIRFIVPMHRNPLVRDVVLPAVHDLGNVFTCEPLGYGEFATLLAGCRIVLTDSGGIQEEAPSLGKPVLVLRDTSERPEAIDAGVAALVGTDAGAIVSTVTRLLHDESAYAAMSRPMNPYGDGQAAHRAARAVGALLGVGERAPDFVYPGSGSGDG